jgi:hypothetical protein
LNGPLTIQEDQVRVVAFQQSQQQLGWSEGRNVQIDTCQ